MQKGTNLPSWSASQFPAARRPASCLGQPAMDATSLLTRNTFFPPGNHRQSSPTELGTPTLVRVASIGAVDGYLPLLTSTSSQDGVFASHGVLPRRNALACPGVCVYANTVDLIQFPCMESIPRHRRGLCGHCVASRTLCAAASA